MKYDFLGVIVFGIVLLIGVAVIAAFITVGIFLIRALSRYVKSGVCCRIYRRKQAGCL